MKPTCLLAAMLAMSTSAMSYADDTKEIEKWLMKSDQAAHEVSYRGIFVYTEGMNIESMRVVHKVIAGGNHQRLFALNGEPREIIRDAEKVWCYLPNKKTGVHEYRQNSKQSFPYSLPDMIGELDQYYKFELEQTLGRIVDRETQILQITPKDNFRYGYRLWLDIDTGLLLRAVLQRPDLSTIEQYMFTDLEITDNILDAWLQPSTSKESLTWYGQDDLKQEQKVKPKTEQPKVTQAEWIAHDLPAGFKLVKTIHRQSPMNKQWFDHYIYSDGIASVSVFIEDTTKSNKPLVNSMSMGAMNVAINTQQGYRISAVGEVPDDTVSIFANNMSRITH